MAEDDRPEIELGPDDRYWERIRYWNQKEFNGVGGGVTVKLAPGEYRQTIRLNGNNIHIEAKDSTDKPKLRGNPCVIFRGDEEVAKLSGLDICAERDHGILGYDPQHPEAKGKPSDQHEVSDCFIHDCCNPRYLIEAQFRPSDDSADPLTEWKEKLHAHMWIKSDPTQRNWPHYFSSAVCNSTLMGAGIDGGVAKKLKVVDCQIFRNRAEGDQNQSADGAVGGGVARVQLLQGCKVFNNYALNGGGGAYDVDYVVDCKFWGNRAENGPGGALWKAISVRNTDVGRKWNDPKAPPGTFFLPADAWRGFDWYPSGTSGGSGLPLFMQYMIPANRAKHGGGLAGVTKEVLHCTIRGNLAKERSVYDVGGDGGGLYDIEGLVADCSIFGNRARRGGGACLVKAIVARCKIYDNHATLGGGLAFVNTKKGISTVGIVNCAIYYNVSGGIHGIKGAIANCTIVGNQGPAVELMSGAGCMWNCIVAFNQDIASEKRRDDDLEQAQYQTYWTWPPSLPRYLPPSLDKPGIGLEKAKKVHYCIVPGLKGGKKGVIGDYGEDYYVKVAKEDGEGPPYGLVEIFGHFDAGTMECYGRDAQKEFNKRHRWHGTEAGGIEGSDDDALNCEWDLQWRVKSDWPELSAWEFPGKSVGANLCADKSYKGPRTWFSADHPDELHPDGIAFDIAGTERPGCAEKSAKPSGPSGWAIGCYSGV
jgi:hypothetical protein